MDIFNYYPGDLTFRLVKDGPIHRSCSGVDFNVPAWIEEFHELLLQLTARRLGKLAYDINVRGAQLLVIQDEGTGTPFGVKSTPEGDLIVVVSIAALRKLVELGERGQLILTEIMVHECTHLDQFIRGDLSMDSLAMTICWKGETWDLSTINPYDVSYLQLPWEREAHEAGLQLHVESGFLKDLETGWEMLLEQYRQMSLTAA